jgi:hypothetical protein
MLVAFSDLVRAVVPHHQMYGARARGVLHRAVRDATQAVCASMPEQFRFHRQSATRDEPAVEILQTPEDADPRGRTQQYQALQRAAGRSPSRRRPRAEIPGQGELPFDAALNELTAGEETAESSTEDHMTGNEERGEGKDE